ncbi:MAG: hypothetical protein GY861_04230 [bacterium]|nr:hypothetical protein [bacterium]
MDEARRLELQAEAAENFPFSCSILDDAPVEVTNPYSGESCVLTPEAVAVYDVIKGAEMLGHYTEVRKGLRWFRKYYPAEYFTLLD